MQNLREAIVDIQQRSTKPDLSPALRSEALGVALHYLRRYSLLIQFCAFAHTLPERAGPQQPVPQFTTWLKARPELLNAFKTKARAKELLS